MSDPVAFTDRYQALGIQYPDPVTMCEGQCEGIGVYPQYRDDGEREGLRPADPSMTTAERAEWDRLHAKNCLSAKGRIRKLGWAIRSAVTLPFRDSVLRERMGAIGAVALGWRQEIRCDGWHMIKCPDCGGSGRKMPTMERPDKESLRECFRRDAERRG